MAFKKSTEGRVYFQGAGGRDEEPRENAPPIRPSTDTAGAPAQLQILALLRSLNDKLKATQTERNAMRAELDNYRRAMDALQDKAYKGERAERVAQETLKELAETRKLMLDIEERQAGIEKETKLSSEKLRVGLGGYQNLLKRLETAEQKQDGVVRRLDEATAQQEKIMRQIEKAIEDRTRFIRKIERIEETVIQTRDALSAKAMVLLTDQNMPGGSIADDESPLNLTREPGVPTAIPDDEFTPQGWNVSRSLQAAAILLLVVGGILAGWAVSETQRPQGLIGSGEFRITDESPQQPVQQRDSAPVENAEKTVGNILSQWNGSGETTSLPEQPADTEQTSTEFTAPAINEPADDIGTLDLNDTAKIQQMLENDPDALASALNGIEPGSETIETTAPETDAAETKIASLPPRETADIDNEEPAPAPAPVYTRRDVNFHDLIDEDSNLPPAVKSIETQAFEGRPEAQHDLAAIYTAGHGGVKQNFKRALFWFEQAAESNVANAAYNLGVLHHQGLGTKPDLAQAIGWYTKAAALGHPEAQYNLGIAYIEGVGVGYDPVKADAYFEKAATQGITEAAYNLGLIYENGLLGKPEPDRALVWYKEAADKGSPEAKAALEQLVKTLNIRMEDIDKLVNDVKRTKKSAAAMTPQTVPAETNTNIVLAQIQERLVNLGLYPGPADGADSPLSQDAIRAYQQLNGMQATGRASDALLVHMLSNDPSKTGAKPILSSYN